MSHNTLKIGAGTADRGGALNASIGDLENVTLSSVAADDVLTYASATSDWRNAAAGSTTNPSYAYLYFAKQKSFGMPYSYTTDSVDLQWRTSSYAPLMGAGVSDQNGINTSWAKGVIVPAGTYLLMIQPVSNASSGQSITWRFYDGSSYFGPKVYHEPTTAKGGAVATAVYTAAGSTTLSLRVETIITSPILMPQQSNLALIGIHITEL